MLRKAGFILALTLLISSCFGTVQSVALEDLGSEFKANTSTAGNQQNSAVAMDSSGDFVVVWQDNSGPNLDVKAQRYGYPNTAQGAETTVAGGLGAQSVPVIAMGASGNYVVCWMDGASGTDDVKAQRYDSSGVAQGAVINVATGANNQQDPAIAMDASGNFVVAWEHNTGGLDDTKAQRFNSSGVAQGGVIDVAGGASDQDDIGIGADSSGNFVICWEDDASGTDDIKAQRYDSSGVAQGGVIDVASGAVVQENVVVAMDATGRFVAVWQAFEGGNYNVKARRYNSDGVAQGSAFDVINGSGNQDNAAIAMDSFGSFMIAWEDDAGGATYDVWAQRYNSAGTEQEFMFRANTYTTNNQLNPAVATDSNGTSIITWESQNQDGSGLGIYGQGFTNISSTWYFAEGYTGSGFEEWLTLQNPTSVTATATITYMYRGGGTLVRTQAVPANSRETISVNDDVGPNKEVSIQVESDQPIVAERPIYFNYQNKWQGGHNTIGATEANAAWFFAEGYTGPGFEEWLTLQNPNAIETDIIIYYLFRGSSELQIKFRTLAANTRETIDVNSDAGANKEVSVFILSDEPIIAERPIYFNYQNKWQGGHNTIGAESPATDWFFAEGYTGSGFENWLTLMNPNSNEANATVTYTFRGGGTPQVKTLTISKFSRETIDVNADVGSNKEVSIKVEADDDIVAERPIYFNYQNKWSGGDNTIGATSLANQWFFAEGYTGPGFEEWLSLQNPNSDVATVTITYTYRGGGSLVKTQTVPADSRESISVNEDVGANKEVSIKVDSTEPVVAERPVYFNYQNKWQGGHNTIGYGP